jgi:hypothetical protein
VTFDIPALRAELATKLATISGLTVYSTVTPKPEVPAAVLAPDQFGAHLTMDGGAQVNFGIEVIVAFADWPSAQDELDAYVSTDTPKSIIAAVEDFVTTVTTVDAYQRRSIDEANFLAVMFHVEVLV